MYYGFKRVKENSNLKIILNKKSYKQIEEIFEELVLETQEIEQKRKVESLEKKLINNMDENAFSELLKLKSQINRD